MMRQHAGVDAALALAWSLWTELGVPGPRRDHERWAVDPERLIVFTASLDAEDPRLGDLAISWVASHGSRVSRGRLDAAAEEMGVEGAAAAFLDEVFAALRPGVEPSGARTRRPIVLPADRPALLRLRVRALLGMDARAEVLATMLGEPARWWRVSEFDDAGVTRRHVARSLDELTVAGVVRERSVGRVRQVRLGSVAEWRRLLGDEGLFHPPWRSVFAWMSLAVACGELAELGPASRRVAAARLSVEVVSVAAELGLELPWGRRKVDEEALVSWVGDVAAALSRGRWGTGEDDSVAPRAG